MARVIKFGLSIMPWAIIAGLLWAGIFIKPQPVGSTVEPPVIERGDAFFGVAAPAEKLIWVAGNYGKIIHSADGGATWGRQATGSSSHIQDIAAWDDKRVIAVGNGGLVHLTEDGGQHWVELRVSFLPPTLDKLLRVELMPEGKAWAVGEMGALLYSGDYGKSWVRQRPEQDTAFNDVTMIDAKSGWVVGEAGSMLRTTDGGTSWSAVTASVRSSLMAVAFKDAQNGVAVGLEGVILVTRDGGKTWHRQAAIRNGVPLKLHYFDVTWDASRGRWFVVGDQGVVASSADGMSTWEGARLGPQEIAWHTRIFSAQGRLLLAGANIGEWGAAENSWRVFRVGK